MEQQKAEAKEEAAKLLQGLANAIAWLAVGNAAALIANKIATHFRDLILLGDLEEIAGEEFAKECKRDPDCWNAWIEISRLEDELNRPIIEEEWRREEATMEELKLKLAELGVAFDCDYDTCYVVYKGYKWDIRDLHLWAEEEGKEDEDG